ncbi:MAG TPA: class I SAM-dependent RNA methyltransferase [Rhodobacteraceae bacterium]|nr:class I SAM-dependent RNA methyltransferase [Paracoccaceae bacterium]
MTIRTTIERLGHRGDGVAPGPVFVPMALPGEVVEGVLDGDRLSDVKIIEPSPDRVRPPCRQFKSCGGCSLQHVSDGFLAQWKAAVVQKALAAHGLDAEVRQLAVSPPGTRRRATLSGRRTKKGAIVGFHGRASDTIVEIPDCKLLVPELMDVIPALREIILTGASRKAALSLAVTSSAAGVDVAASGGKPLDAALRETLAAQAARFGLARLTWNGETVACLHPPVQQMGGAQVVPPPGAFLQATETGQTALVSEVLRITDGARRLADLFSGCGTFSLPLASTSEVHAVEGDAALLLALNHGWRHATGLKEVTTEERDLFRRPLLADELRRFDAAVINPPRAGAEAQVAEIAASGLQRIAFVSCNPQTFARDVRTLVAAGFELGPVQVVDQFRWSPHVELVGALFR